jgi:TRAP-type C4-dicarboxylate transport system substrate-binding protein
MPAFTNGCTAGPRRAVVAGLAAAAALAPSPASLAQQAKTNEWRYGPMNPPNSAAGMQAQALAEAVSTGTIALSRNTAGGIGSLHEPFGALDTPCLYRDVDHLV